MKSLLTVAESELDQAQRLLLEIGDHSEAFEHSLMSGDVSADLVAQVRRVVLLLRSALDQTARAIVAAAGGTSSDLVFPIAPLGATPDDFAVQLRSWVPNGVRLDASAVAALNSAQPFGGSEWLLGLDLAGTVDGIDLSVKRVRTTLTETAREDGTTESRIAPSSESGVGRVLLLQPVAGGSENEFEAVHVVLNPSGIEVLSFLEEAAGGVRGVLSRLSA